MGEATINGDISIKGGKEEEEKEPRDEDLRAVPLRYQQ